uniref:Uncharacterized protein n=1 Tax=Rhizophora mucronata TaxID=61149 RepID=A0A2P2NW43_RHIMU
MASSNAFFSSCCSSL